MNRTQVWYTVGSLVHRETRHGVLLPAPETLRVQDHSIHIETLTCADVDTWASYIGLPTPWLVTPASYGTVEFYREGAGWLNASIISVACEKPSEVDRMKEEMRRNGERESVAT